MRSVLQWGACGVVLVLFALGLLHDEPPAKQQQYCDMWEIWHADRRAGVPVEQRYGWPDQAGRYYGECEQ